MNRLLFPLLAAIVLADLAQPALLAWEPRFVAALGGALFYTIAGLAIGRGQRWALWGVVLLPVVPLSTLVLASLGVAVPVAPNAAMIAIAGLQVTAGGLAALRLRRGAGAAPAVAA